MKNVSRWLMLFAVAMIFVPLVGILFGPESVSAVLAQSPDMNALPFIGVVGMFAQKLTAPTRILTDTYAQLRSRLRPQSLEAPEALPYVFFDTQTYVAAGVARLEFFRNVQADSTLGNMETAGSLPEGTFFDIHRIFVSALRLPTTSVLATSVYHDVAELLNVARGTVTITANAKPLGPIPLRFFGDAGQPSGFLTAGAAAEGGSAAGFSANGGFPVNGAIKLGPAAKFGVTLDFVSTAINVDTPLQVALFGILYRKIG